ncbi:alpha/beta fold hydrolase [Persicimonas caeni]|uniref:Alpha/beta fold hydrolase n=1 Tax=Persicimonas caeni TaxID=2292766 RepID=A0A4Y6PPK9_PERCE|nr:alpha/beta fold hydrolase [Persicimonas caeni]QDG50276.1 alpha/beta fold hydrolase [Persicimonas caeni]QED31497.1 alpha/beta fold hydrolase [Persicimonas caeni]
MKRLSTIAAALVYLSLLAGCLSFQPGPLPDEPQDASFTEVADTRVRFVDVGEGPPVVLVHGFAASLNTWAPVIPVLAENHRVIALDLKGFGWSGRPEGDYSPEAQAELVWSLLDERGVDKTAVVAHSWGSSVALQMALSKPERVERIALYDAWVYAEQLPSFFVWARAGGIGELMFRLFYNERPEDKIALAFYDKRYVTQDLVEHTRKMQQQPGTMAAHLAAVRGQRYEEVQDRYKSIDQPVLLLWGREDKVTTLEMGERLARDLPNARLQVYPRCGHFPMLEAQSASTRDLAEFLNLGGSASSAGRKEANQ